MSLVATWTDDRCGSCIQNFPRLIANVQRLVKVVPLDKYSGYMTFTCAHLISDDFGHALPLQALVANTTVT